ncbi:hypothetical protein AURANDRAFT_67984 [Aureococcus anophagefferens]|uniref:Uncharacterized protein n=1 Tax=Aureococcus anophagefferens TaxID=44056 RepID=F0YN46_AURAN|nr:hypothetical protein AURANDRAFT_67984 [Aureococcus anophagefferens]EGB03467.1 hypothetical protein AURANDRAFT_67984 [Aureococcus anophagefferens]|eukprot:XP_009041866.1 hypothetical protein AURANDRAFT_67984 [Aureococcus anophagefferens]
MPCTSIFEIPKAAPSNENTAKDPYVADMYEAPCAFCQRERGTPERRVYVIRSRRLEGARISLLPANRVSLRHQPGYRLDRWMIEEERLRKLRGKLFCERVCELRRRHRVQSGVHQRRVRGDGRAEYIEERRRDGLGHRRGVLGDNSPSGRDLAADLVSRDFLSGIRISARWVVEQQSRRKLGAEALVESRRELGGPDRVEPSRHERRVGRDGSAGEQGRDANELVEKTMERGRRGMSTDQEQQSRNAPLAREKQTARCSSSLKRS